MNSSNLNDRRREGPCTTQGIVLIDEYKTRILHQFGDWSLKPAAQYYQLHGHEIVYYKTNIVTRKFLIWQDRTILSTL